MTRDIKAYLTRVSNPLSIDVIASGCEHFVNGRNKHFCRVRATGKLDQIKKYKPILQDKSVIHIEDFNGTEFLFTAKEKDLALMSGGAWKRMGATPFQDDSEDLQRFLAEV